MMPNMAVTERAAAAKIAKNRRWLIPIFMGAPCMRCLGSTTLELFGSSELWVLSLLSDYLIFSIASYSRQCFFSREFYFLISSLICSHCSGIVSVTRGEQTFHPTGGELNEMFGGYSE